MLSDKVIPGRYTLKLLPLKKVLRVIWLSQSTIADRATLPMTSGYHWLCLRVLHHQHLMVTDFGVSYPGKPGVYTVDYQLTFGITDVTFKPD